MLGDGIASNKLQSIPKISRDSKNASFHFRKCLFRVETPRKYNYNKLLQNFKNEDPNLSSDYRTKLSYLERKSLDENEENIAEYTASLGKPIIFGQTIHLRHIYSGCFLSINPNILSKQYGCLEMSLQEDGSENSIFRFISSSNLKQKEDVVCYSDSVIISSGVKGTHYVHVWDQQIGGNSFFNTKFDPNDRK